MGAFSWNFSKILGTAMSKSNHIFMQCVLSKKWGLLEDLIRSALSFVIKNICKFKTFWFLMRCLIWSSDIKKNIQNSTIILPIFSATSLYCWLTSSFL